MNFNPFEVLNNLNKIKDSFENVDFEQYSADGQSGGGLVKLSIDGKFNITHLELDPIAVDNRDIQMLTDLIVSAHNDAASKLRETLKAKLVGTISENFPGFKI